MQVRRALLTSKTPSFDDIQAGDVLVYSEPGTAEHYVFVLSKASDSITVCEGNYGGNVHWGRVIPKSSITSYFSIMRSMSQEQ